MSALEDRVKTLGPILSKAGTGCVVQAQLQKNVWFSLNGF